MRKNALIAELFQAIALVPPWILQKRATIGDYVDGVPWGLQAVPGPDLDGPDGGYLDGCYAYHWMQDGAGLLAARHRLSLIRLVSLLLLLF